MAEYSSPVNGIVGGLRSDATSEPGNVLLFILVDAAPVSGAAAYPEWIAALRLADRVQPRSQPFLEGLRIAVTKRFGPTGRPDDCPGG